jgi:hypothetical protein
MSPPSTGRRTVNVSDSESSYFYLCARNGLQELAPRAGLGRASGERSELLRDPEDSPRKPTRVVLPER